MKLPSGRQISYGITTGGRIGSVTGTLNTNPPVNYASAISYAPHGALAGGTFGPLSQSLTYNSRLQPTGITAKLGATILWALTNVYSATANNGNIASQTVDATGAGGVSVSASFVCDSLNRLQSSTESGAGVTQTYGYTATGNRWVDTGQSNYLQAPSFTATGANAYDAAMNRLVTTGSFFGYDGAGNLTTMGGYALQYDAENRQTQATLNDTTVYWYDGDGRRVKKQSDTGPATAYVYSADGELAAEYGGASQASGEQYLVQDHLGSTRMTVNSSGLVQGLHDYLPFGEEIPSGVGGRNGLYGAADGITQKFTGKERGQWAESGLDYFDVRYFSSAQGRFTSPDPLTWQVWQYGSDDEKAKFQEFISDPQNFNLYAYVRNNPLKYTDPTGTYYCNGSTDECNKVKAAYDQAVAAAANKNLSKDERAAINGVLKFLGKTRRSKWGVYRVRGDPEGVSGGDRHYPAVRKDLHSDHFQSSKDWRYGCQCSFRNLRSRRDARPQRLLARP